MVAAGQGGWVTIPCTDRASDCLEKQQVHVPRLTRERAAEQTRVVETRTVPGAPFEYQPGTMPPLGSSTVSSSAMSTSAALFGGVAVAAALCVARRTNSARLQHTRAVATAGDSKPAADLAPLSASTGGGAGAEVALVDTELRKLVANGAFRFDFSTDLDRYVQPASIDLPLPKKAWLVKEKVLPFQKCVRELLVNLALDECSLEGDGAMLLRGQTYLVHCGSIALPATHRGLLSPKSSIGRVDLMVRGVVDQCGLYDIIDGGEQRELWLEISPQSFNVRVKAGIALTQLMVFADLGSVSDESADSSTPSAPRPLVYNDIGEALPLRLYKDMLILSLRVPDGEKDTWGQDGRRQASQATRLNADDESGRLYDSRGSSKLLAGYEAVTTNEVIDLSRVNAHDPSTFFRPVYAEPGAGKMTLEKDRFYILATKVKTSAAVPRACHRTLTFWLLLTCSKEKVSIPLTVSGEMVPFSHHVGELRAHYAGFFDPGFGYGRSGELKGAVGVLEVRPHETITIYDGQVSTLRA